MSQGHPGQQPRQSALDVLEEQLKDQKHFNSVSAQSQHKIVDLLTEALQDLKTIHHEIYSIKLYVIILFLAVVVLPFLMGLIWAVFKGPATPR